MERIIAPRANVDLPLDKEYRPIVLFNQLFESSIEQEKDSEQVSIAIVRDNDQVARFDTFVFRDTAQFDANYMYVERRLKTLLWIKGGYHIYYAGPADLGEKLVKDYSEQGNRSFDVQFMSSIYQQPFQVQIVPLENIPNQQEQSIPMGRHLEGQRIGFDAGGSDRKVSAVVDGEAIYSEEVVWHPKTNADPDYHYNGIKDSIARAASKLDRIDAIGVSSAGIFIDDEVAAASLFRQVPSDRFDQDVRPIFKRIAKEFGNVPIKVANDGDVTALAGAMSLEDNNVLGIAMGTSQAAGYVDTNGHITGWLNELAFVPVDLNPASMMDEWSTDVGVGVTYFSQDAVIKLAKHAHYPMDDSLSPADKLKVMQEALANHDPIATEIFRTIGIYLGYSIAYYSEFYDMKHLLILGRVTSKRGGDLILEWANNVLENEFPSIHKSLHLTLPDEQNRRVGQSIAAASLPQL